MKKCRVGIMTFFRVNNFGAVLQAYALSKTCEKIGYETEIINYECSFLEKPYRLENLKNRGVFLYLTSLFGFLTRFPRNRKFEEFRKNELCVSQKKYDRTHVIETSYDLIIAGSDQVWNLEATNGDVGYLCEGFPEKTVKCSYAASFGKTDMDQKWVELIKHGLDHFTHITCREEEGTRFVNSLTDTSDCQTVIDPVFLLSGDEWRSLAVSPKTKEKYILVYQQSITPTVVEVAKRLTKEKKRKILFIPFPMGKAAFGSCKTNYSPKEWLGLIQNAEFVVTDSFHGTAFSIVLNKDFYVSTSGTGPKTSSRIHGLLEKMNLKDRYVVKADSLSRLGEKIRWDEVNKRIDVERAKSMKYLREIGQYVSNQG